MTNKKNPLKQTLIAALEYIEENAIYTNMQADFCSSCGEIASYEENPPHSPFIEEHEEDCRYVAVAKELRAAIKAVGV